MFRCFIFCLFFIGACSQPQKDNKINRSFYYWKSRFDLDSVSRSVLSNLKVSTLYVKYFDVVWDHAFKQPLPVAIVKSVDKTDSFGIIPTVFITNETLLQIDSVGLKKLSSDILKLIKSINEINGWKPLEQVQIDCDWSASTKDKYFQLLEMMQQQDTSNIYSATIRLHQLKYASSTGVPPVDRGLLMCYNMGNLKHMNTRNSILDLDEMRKYTSGYYDYALPLDYAFPLFSWTVLFRNNSYTGLLQNLVKSDLEAIGVRKDENRFEVIKDTIIKGYALHKGDVLRLEDSDVTTILKAQRLLYSKIQQDSFSVVLYHIDPSIFSKYNHHELEKIYTGMR